MIHQTIVDAATVAAHLDDPMWRSIDCRFVLGDPEAGARKHAEATIPGSSYAHLDDDLSGPIIQGETGRHPLPTREEFAATLGRWGVTAETQVVAFDDSGGPFASRLWWMLRWVGHDAVAVLDGGTRAFVVARQTLVPGFAPVEETTYVLGEPKVELATVDDVLATLDDPEQVLIDARSAPRFSGERKGADPVAGHIPGAISAPYMGNLRDDGQFLHPAHMRARYDDRLRGAASERAIAYCGSGVTACHNVLSMLYAGLPMPRLYPGSWSEWILDPSRPRATGTGT